MLSPSNVIIANEQQVAAKVMDGEAILINLGTGAYYSIPGTGGFIWSVIETKSSLDGVVSAVVAHYDVSQQQAEADVTRLCTELLDEGLVSVAASGAAVGIAPPSPATRLAYEAPRLEKFTDMAEMFALDPPLPGLGVTGAAKRG